MAFLVVTLAVFAVVFLPALSTVFLLLAWLLLVFLAMFFFFMFLIPFNLVDVVVKNSPVVMPAYFPPR